MIAVLKRDGLWPPLVPSVVLVESVTGRPRFDANTNRFLKTCDVRELLPDRLARRAAELRSRARQGSAVDAIVVVTAEPDGTVLSADLKDLRALALLFRGCTGPASLTSTSERAGHAGDPPERVGWSRSPDRRFHLVPFHRQLGTRDTEELETGLSHARAQPRDDEPVGLGTGEGVKVPSVLPQRERPKGLCHELGVKGVADQPRRRGELTADPERVPEEPWDRAVAAERQV